MVVRNSSIGGSPREHPRSLSLNQWPDADRRAWEDACRPGSRLKPGGAASHLARVTRETIAWRYGTFLGFLQQTGRLNRDGAAASHVIPSNVEAYVAGLTAEVRSATIHGYIQGLRRAAELLGPIGDFSWLVEIEKDLKLVMEPRSKFDRLVFTGRLVEAGLTLVAEALEFARTDFVRARGVRNGLIIALLALCPNSAQEFRVPGNRVHFQGGFRDVVDRPSSGRDEISPARRASGPGVAQPRYRCLSEPVPTRSSSGKVHDGRTLDLRKDLRANERISS